MGALRPGRLRSADWRVLAQADIPAPPDEWRMLVASRRAIPVGKHTH